MLTLWSLIKFYLIIFYFGGVLTRKIPRLRPCYFYTVNVKRLSSLCNIAPAVIRRPEIRADNGSHFVTRDPRDPSVSWPVTRMTRDPWPSPRPWHSLQSGINIMGDCSGGFRHVQRVRPNRKKGRQFLRGTASWHTDGDGASFFQEK